VPPARFVAGVVQVARALNDAPTWTLVTALIDRMVCAGMAPAGSFAAD
jgi:hypothetical protein